MALIQIVYFVVVAVFCYRRLKQRSLWLSEKDFHEKMKLINELSIDQQNIYDLRTEIQLEPLTKDLRKNKKVLYFHFIGFMKKVMFSIVIIFMSSVPTVQVIFLILVESAFICYTIYLKPFENKCVLFAKLTAGVSLTVLFILIACSHYYFNQIYDQSNN